LPHLKRDNARDGSKMSTSGQRTTNGCRAGVTGTQYAIDRLDRPGLVFHSLRNTVATVLHNAGVPEVEAAALLGHTVPTMSYGLYSGGLSLERLRQVAEAIRYEGGWARLAEKS
jgi:integrase